ncbi:hypothetical protein GCM10010218_52800 [Streptomyces mashuensis]|uniref:Helix-turn-helix domain-containing protein n=1 Tax=Streptomyces mashuensis TaxID=33904 RepID=A0A919B756_9ACTN|nr:hypothetical protein [Streptomyces mashuensis]GHF64646.1 hypothetical protein GCM10010218_52800 [Streptomyces mashuensis]
MDHHAHHTHHAHHAHHANGVVRRTAAACPGAGCERREASGLARRLAAPGSGLCEACRARLSLELTRLPALYEECGRLLGGSDQPREKVSGGPLPGLPFNVAASEARSAITGVLGAWAALVAQQRRLPAPPRTPVHLALFLVRHADWLAAHPAAGEVSQEIAQVTRRARRVVDPRTRRRVALGPCAEAGCDGTLVAVVSSDRPEQPAAITCDADAAHHWEGSQWLALSRRLRGTGGGAGTGTGTGAGAGATPGVARTRWLSAADIARLWDMAPGSVYRHASQRGWRRLSRSGRTYYHEADVQETFDGRVRTTAG